MKLKSIQALALLTLTLTSLPAVANTAPKLACWVVLSSGDLNSFIAPLKGDTIILDLGNPDTIDLRFNRPDGGQSYISMHQSHLAYLREIPAGSHDHGGWRFNNVHSDNNTPRVNEIVIDVLKPFHSRIYSAWISTQIESGQIGYVALECKKSRI